METKTEKSLITKDSQSIQILEVVEKKESGEKQIPFSEAVKGFWEKFDNISEEIKQSSSMSREEFLKDTISFDELKKVFAKKMDERIGTSLYK